MIVEGFHVVLTVEMELVSNLGMATGCPEAYYVVLVGECDQVLPQGRLEG